MEGQSFVHRLDEGITENHWVTTSFAAKMFGFLGLHEVFGDDDVGRFTGVTIRAWVKGDAIVGLSVGVVLRYKFGVEGVYNAWLSHVCCACLLRTTPFWSARSYKRRTLSDNN